MPNQGPSSPSFGSAAFPKEQVSSRFSADLAGCTIETPARNIAFPVGQIHDGSILLYHCRRHPEESAEWRSPQDGRTRRTWGLSA